MTSDDDPRIDQLSADEAFSLVSDETRFGILTALQAAGEPLPFSALREAVGVEDTGRFNYHLDKLAGHFLAKTTAGYEIAPPGVRLVGAVRSGAYTAALNADPVPVDGECLVCGADLIARFRDHGVTIDCPGCETTFTNPETPAGLFADHPVEDAPKLVAQWNRLRATAVEASLCPNCYGHVDNRLELSGDPDTTDWVADSGLLGMVFSECSRCGWTFNAAVQFAVLTHPRVAAYHHEHGVDLRTTPPWELDWLEPGRGSIESRNPVRIALPIPLDDETREFVFDADLELVEVRHQ